MLNHNPGIFIGLAEIVLKCSELVKFNQWKSEMNDEESNFVLDQFEQLLTENIFKL